MLTVQLNHMNDILITWNQEEVRISIDFVICLFPPMDFEIEF